MKTASQIHKTSIFLISYSQRVLYLSKYKY